MRATCVQALLVLAGVGACASASGVCRGPAFERAVWFNGATGCVFIPAAAYLPLGNAAYTVEMWVWLDAYGNYPANGQIYNGIMLARGAEGPHMIQMMAVVNGNLWLTHWLPDRDTTISAPLRTWMHVATTWDGVTERLYVDGQERWSAPITTGLNVQGGAVAIGRHVNYDGFFLPGAVDEVRIWNVARSAAQIAANAGVPLTGQEPGLVALWNFDESSGPAIDLVHGQNGVITGSATRIDFSAPLLPVTPAQIDGCGGRSRSLTVHVGADGPHEFQWYHDGVAVEATANPSAITRTLEFPYIQPWDDGEYHCVVSGSCGESSSLSAVITGCAADFDCTGFVDTDDFTAFVLAFEDGTDDADFDGTGFVDTDDFTAFVIAFEAGC
ncbi:MAG: hypothetical protein GIKADHBN_02285 [Phycisphaerales bacterium]|nr:hypothetical protein [Phycisphaerales bacterium]